MKHAKTDLLNTHCHWFDLLQLSTKLRRDYMQEPWEDHFNALSYCLRFEKVIVSLKSAIEILEKFFERLDTHELRELSFKWLSTNICTVLYAQIKDFD